MNPSACHEWVKVLEAQSLNTGAEMPTEAFHVATPSDEFGGPTAAVLWRVKIEGASADDVTMRLYGAPGADADLKSSKPKQARTLLTSDADPFLDDGQWDYAELGTGGLVTFQRTGSEDGITVSMWIQRIKWK